MATMTSVPWLACVLLLGLAHFTYPQERRRKMADEEEQEGEAEVEAVAEAAAATTKAEGGAAAAAAEDILETSEIEGRGYGAVATAARNNISTTATSSYSPVVTHDDDGHGATNSPTNRSRSSSAAGDVWSSQPPRDLELVELASTRNPLVVDVDS